MFSQEGFNRLEVSHAVFGLAETVSRPLPVERLVRHTTIGQSAFEPRRLTHVHSVVLGSMRNEDRDPHLIERVDR